MIKKLRRTWAEIDLDALKQNYKNIRGLVAPTTKIMAVVKADAYGHGDVRVAHALDRQGADWFAVSSISEAARLRDAGIEKPILILGYTPISRAYQLHQLQITQTVYSYEYGKKLSDALCDVGEIDIHIKIDSGMSRLGYFGENAVQEIADTVKLPNLKADGIFTHFTCADEFDDESVAFTQEQYRIFTDIISKLEQKGIVFALHHCCNSAATLCRPEYHMDMVRPGLIMYGIDPTGKSPVQLTPVMRFKSVVGMVKEKQAGNVVSYGNTYRLDKPTRIATVPIGYADGYHRALSNKGYLCRDGQKLPIIGRICMDQLMVDAGDTDLKIGDELIVFGTEKDGVTAADLAKLCDTIPYELICVLGKRVQRVYVQDGKVRHIVDYMVEENH